MFRKVNTPVLGVIENMSGLILSGNTDPDNSKLEINGQKVETDNNGSFNISLDLFKTGGGEKESERLGVPLLGKVLISESIMSSTDSGTPLTTHESLNDIGKIYVSISKQIVSLIE